MLRLFFKADDSIIVADFRDAESASLVRRYLDGGDGDIGVLLPVLVQHLAVVHLVNMVAGEN